MGSIKHGPSTKKKSITNFTSKLLNCVVLEHIIIKTNHLRSLVVKLVTDNIFVDGPSFRIHTLVEHTV